MNEWKSRIIKYSFNILINSKNLLNKLKGKIYLFFIYLIRFFQGNKNKIS